MYAYTKRLSAGREYYTKTLKRMRTFLLICIGTNEYKLQATSKLENWNSDSNKNNGMLEQISETSKESSTNYY